MDPNHRALRYVSKEVLIMVSSYLSETDLNSFARTARPFYETLNFELYRRNVRNSYSSALRWAAAHDNAATARLSLTAGASQEKLRVIESECLLPEEVLHVYPSTSKPDEVDFFQVTPLLIAAAHGNQALAQILIEAGADLDECSPVSAAAYFGHEAMAELLLNHDIKLDDDFEWDNPPLTLAIWKGYDSIVDTLLDKGAVCNWFGMNILIRQNNVNILRILFDRGTSVGSLKKAMFSAARLGRRETLNLVLNYNPNLDTTDSNGQSLLHYAICYGWAELVATLLQANVNTEATHRKTGHTPLFTAVEENNMTAARLLIESGANLEAKDAKLDGGMTPLAVAAGHGHEQIVRMLIEKGANIEALDKGGRTPLIIAAMQSYPKVIELLLESGANVDACDADYKNVVHFAARDGDHESILSLILRHVNFKGIDTFGNTPLSLACENGHLGTAMYLWLAGASLGESSSMQLHVYPLEVATAAGHILMVDFLLQFYLGLLGDRVHKALLRASEKGHEGIAGTLIRSGADVNFEMGSTTPLRLAVDNNHEEMTSALIRHGASVTDKTFLWKMNLRGYRRVHLNLLQLACHRGNERIIAEIRKAYKQGLRDRGQAIQ